MLEFCDFPDLFEFTRHSRVSGVLDKFFGHHDRPYPPIAIGKRDRPHKSKTIALFPSLTATLGIEYTLTRSVWGHLASLRKMAASVDRR